MLQFIIPGLTTTGMLQRFLYRLIAILYIFFVFLTSSLFFIIAVLIWIFTYPFDKRLWLLHRFTSLWASLYIWVMPPWSVSVHDRQLIDADATYVIGLQPPVIGRYFGRFYLVYALQMGIKSRAVQYPANRLEYVAESLH